MSATHIWKAIEIIAFQISAEDKVEMGWMMEKELPRLTSQFFVFRNSYIRTIWHIKGIYETMT